MTSKISDYDNDSLKGLISQVQKRGSAVLHDQELSKSEFVSTFTRIGECETPEQFMNDSEHPEIFYVTGKKDDKGNKIGMFGDGELGWHSNGNSRHNVDKILIGLYCVEGDVNTTLSVCNTVDPFYSLTPEEQEYWKSIKIKIKFQNDTMYHLDEDDPELEFMSASKGSLRRLVGVHPYTGNYYFYFPYHFIIKAWQGSTVIDHNEMIERLKKIIFKSRYQFHHVFASGDLLLMDQFATLHRRTPVMSDRLLYRIASDYSQLF